MHLDKINNDKRKRAAKSEICHTFQEKSVTTIKMASTLRATRVWADFYRKIQKIMSHFSKKSVTTWTNPPHHSKIRSVPVHEGQQKDEYKKTLCDYKITKKAKAPKGPSSVITHARLLGNEPDVHFRYWFRRKNMIW